ncbi:MAG: hypothetical protein J6I66_04510 [Lachnospiraceae bacterium]|nr:hypothetical protein [Lachnospiraceae bacterium]
MKKTFVKILLTAAAVLFLGLIPKTTASAAVKTMPDGELFDPSFYAATYKDVYQAFGMNEALLYQHYLLCGIKEKRLPYAGYIYHTPDELAASGTIITMPDGALFDPVYYAAKNPDVVQAFGLLPESLYAHYLYCGAAEGRLPYEGYKASELKLSFSTTSASANVVTEADVISAVRQAAMYRVTNLTITSVWQGRLSSETITALIKAQAPFLKTAYGAKITVSDPRMYGLATNPTIEIGVTLKF